MQSMLLWGCKNQNLRLGFKCFLVNFFIPILMKRSLAPPRRDKPTGGDGKASSKTMPVKQSEEKVMGNQKVSTPASQMDHQDRIISQKFQERYRNKNLNVLPTQMLVALSGLTTLDISYNKLTDSQIELIMNSCTKLSTFCMQGNLTNLIPASISKLKLLVNFRHDWVKLNPDDMYEPEKRLAKIKEVGRRGDFVVKINRIDGLDFICYSQIAEIALDQKLIEKIDKCQCSVFAKENMLKAIEDFNKGNIKRPPVSQEEYVEKFNSQKSEGRSLSKRGQTPLKRETIHHFEQREKLSQTAQTASKILDHRDHSINEASLEEEEQIYFNPSMPLHNLFANFDKNHYAPAEIDGLLLRGYNPNQYDSNGLSPYHLCILQRQKKGLDYLLEISSNNPGFFDLEMPSIKQGRNILHFSVHCKNYLFTKALIDFGIPVDKRDAGGSRLIHLADQNLEFIILLRKLLRKRTHVARNLSALSVPPIPHQNKKNYIKHPQRQKQQSRFRITYSRNDKLLEMFEAGAGIPNLKM